MMQLTAGGTGQTLLRKTCLVALKSLVRYRVGMPLGQLHPWKPSLTEGNVDAMRNTKIPGFPAGTDGTS